jgi:hypothetical protein
MAVEPSCFPGWNLLACQDCGRPVRLISQHGPAYRQSIVGRREVNRALRAARRARL